ISFFYAFSYWSTQVSTYLNEKILGKNSVYFDVETIVAVMLFNAFPVDKVLGSGQRFLTRLFGSEKSCHQIKLEQFLETQNQIVDSIEDFKFLDMLDEIIESGALSSEETENFFKAFFGNKTPKDIFGEDHAYGKRRYDEIIPRMVDEDMHALST